MIPVFQGSEDTKTEKYCRTDLMGNEWLKKFNADKC